MISTIICSKQTRSAKTVSSGSRLYTERRSAVERQKECLWLSIQFPWPPGKSIQGSPGQTHPKPAVTGDTAPALVAKRRGWRFQCQDGTRRSRSVTIFPRSGTLLIGDRMEQELQKALCLIAAFGLLPQLMLAQGKSKEVEAQEYGHAPVLRVVVDQQQLPSDSAIGEGGVNALSQGGDVGWRLGVRPPPHRRKAIPRERGRPARTLFLQTACHPRPLPCKAHQTRLYGDLFHRAGVCAGETPALPGGLSSRVVVPPPREWSEKSVQCTKSPMKHRPTGNRHKA